MSKRQPQLPTGDILELLGDGRDSELSSLSGDDDDFFNENEYPLSEIEKFREEQIVDDLINDFENDNDFNDVFGINNGV